MLQSVPAGRARNGPWHSSILVREMAKQKIETSMVSFNAAIVGTARTGEMSEQKIETSTISMAATIIGTCSKFSHWLPSFMPSTVSLQMDRLKTF
jgi:subtilase family serine protease